MTVGIPSCSLVFIACILVRNLEVCWALLSISFFFKSVWLKQSVQYVVGNAFKIGTDERANNIWKLVFDI